jgi:hypothetical protein
VNPVPGKDAVEERIDFFATVFDQKRLPILQRSLSMRLEVPMLE